MSVCSLEFLFCLFLLSMIFPFVPGPRRRQVLLALCNAAFLYLLVPNSASWAALTVFLLSGWVMAKLLEVRPSSWALSSYLALLVLAFVVLKKYELLYACLPEYILGHAVSVIGISYMLFRQIHLLVDVAQGQVTNVSLWSYMNYQLNLFAILSGPIQRYQEFQTSWEHLTLIPVDRHELLKVSLRIFAGVIKVALAGAVLLAVYNWCTEPFDTRNPEALDVSRSRAALSLAVMFYAYPAYVYFNFAGYCDIVIGGGRLVGLQLPENFNHPYRSRNMIDYWTRWHRTLGFWIRDYLFTPLYKAVAQLRPRYAPSLAFACYFVAFFLAGIWHGSTWNFALFGLVNAFGVAATKVWELVLVRRYGRPGLRNYMQSSRNRLIATATTFHFACFTFLFFPTPFDRTYRVLRAMFISMV